MATSITPQDGRHFGLLPEPERQRCLVLHERGSQRDDSRPDGHYIGMTAKHVIEQHKYEQTELIFPTTPPPPAQGEDPSSAQACRHRRSRPSCEMEARRSTCRSRKPEPKPIEMEAKVASAGDEGSAQAGGHPGSAAQGGADGGHARAGQQGEAVDRARASGRDLRRHAQSQCHPAGHGGGHRQSLRRHAGPGGRAARRGGIDRHWQWTQIRLKRRHSRQGCLGRNSRRQPEPRPPAIDWRQGWLRRHSDADGRSGRSAADAPPCRGTHQSRSDFQAAGAIHQRKHGS